MRKTKKSVDGEARRKLVVEDVQRVLPVFTAGTSLSLTPGASTERIPEEERLVIACGMLGGTRRGDEEKRVEWGGG